MTMEKLDFRCRATGCKTAPICRRWLTGPESKNSPVPFAAFDMRDTVACDGFMQRVWARFQTTSFRHYCDD